MKYKSQLIIYSCLVAAMIFWSFSFIWYKMVFNYFNPITVVLFRLVISSAFLFSFLFLSGKLQKIKKKDFGLFFLLSFFEPFIYFIGESFGIKFVSSTLAAIIVSTIPIFNAVAAYYAFNERLSPMNISGVLLSISGVILVIFSGNLAINAAPMGVALMFVAVIAAVGYSIMIKKLTSHYNALTIVAYENFIGIFLFLPLFLLIDLNDLLNNGGFHYILKREAIVPLLELGIFASSFAFVFFTYGVQKLGMTKANVFTNIIPVFTAIFASYILDEKLTILKITGIIIVVAGLFLSQIKRIPLKNVFKPKITHRY